MFEQEAVVFRFIPAQAPRPARPIQRQQAWQPDSRRARLSF